MFDYEVISYATFEIKVRRFPVKLKNDKHGLHVCLKKPKWFQFALKNEQDVMVNHLINKFPHYPIRKAYVL